MNQWMVRIKKHSNMAGLLFKMYIITVVNDYRKTVSPG